MSNRVALTTVDNPFDPFEQFNDWFEFDIEKGYYTCSRLARLTNLSDDMSEAESNKEIERAIDELIKYDVFDVYKKVIKETSEDSDNESIASETSADNMV
jgi:hypothetical protein